MLFLLPEIGWERREVGNYEALVKDCISRLLAGGGIREFGFLDCCLAWVGVVVVRDWWRPVELPPLA